MCSICCPLENKAVVQVSERLKLSYTFPWGHRGISLRRPSSQSSDWERKMKKGVQFLDPVSLNAQSAWFFNPLAVKEWGQRLAACKVTPEAILSIVKNYYIKIMKWNVKDKAEMNDAMCQSEAESRESRDRLLIQWTDQVYLKVVLLIKPNMRDELPVNHALYLFVPKWCVCKDHEFDVKPTHIYTRNKSICI